jgi:nucleoside-diphosphate-sugar epimerase
MKVAITGAAGYLGGTLVSALEHEHDLTLSDIRSAPGFGVGEHDWRECDVTDFDAVSALVDGHDAVIHTVALVRGRSASPLARFIDVMVKGTWNVTEACARAAVPRLINVSSITAGGWPAPTDQPWTTAQRHPFTPNDIHYSLSKWVGETIVDAYSDAYPSTAFLTIRPGVIAGDGANPDPVRVDAPHWFNYVDVRDVAGAIGASLAQPVAPRGTYAIVAGREDSQFDWKSAAADFGYSSINTWPDL